MLAFAVMGIYHVFSDEPGAQKLKTVNSADINKTFFSQGQEKEMLVSLTFDDGPDDHVTPKIINILNKYNVKGNFFFMGEKVLINPEVVRSAYYDGHLVLNHSFNHPDFVGKNMDFVNQNLDKTDAAFKSVIGKTPALFRPPYEILTANLVKSTKEHDLKIVTWSLDSFDWRVKDKKILANTVIDNITPGGIVLMHSVEGNEATAKALPEIIEGLLAKGYKIVTLDQLLKTDAYK